MAYITNANFRRITREFDVPEEDKNFSFNDIIIWESPNGKVIDKNNPYIFGNWEVDKLLLFKEFCKNTDLAVKHFYRKIPKPKDSFRYIDPEKRPSYHIDRHCEAMNSSLHRIEIPEQIRDQGEEKVKEYREWWKRNEKLRLSNPQAFVAKLNIVFGLDLQGFSVEDVSNSGVYDIDDNRSVDEINENIRHLFNELYRWAKEGKDRWNIFLNFKKLSFLGESEDPIYSDLGYYSESEVKEVLKIVHSKKTMITEELKRLYQRRYIPDLNFQTSLLDSLGFVPCFHCMTDVYVIKTLK